MFSERELITQLEKERTAREISQSLSLSLSEVLKRITYMRKMGIPIKRTIYDNGCVSYQMTIEPEDSRSNTIDLTLTNPETFSFVAISDTHFGNAKENLDYLKRVYEYCDSNNIHTILHAGDLIDGLNRNHPQNIENVEEQLFYVVEAYPHSNGITNIICLGNHDDSLHTVSAINMVDTLTHQRDDFILNGYGFGIINIENDQIILKHPIHGVMSIPYVPHKLVLHGHYHKAGILDNSCDIFSYVPSLSDLQFEPTEDPGFLKIDIILNEQGEISKINLEQFTINRQILKTDSHEFRNITHIENYTEQDIIYPKQSARQFIRR